MTWYHQEWGSSLCMYKGNFHSWGSYGWELSRSFSFLFLHMKLRHECKCTKRKDKEKDMDCIFCILRTPMVSYRRIQSLKISSQHLSNPTCDWSWLDWEYLNAMWVDTVLYWWFPKLEVSIMASLVWVECNCLISDGYPCISVHIQSAKRRIITTIILEERYFDTQHQPLMTSTMVISTAFAGSDGHQPMS